MMIVLKRIIVGFIILSVIAGILALAVTLLLKSNKSMNKRLESMERIIKSSKD